MNNLLGDLPTSLDQELVTVLTQSAYVRIERIVSQGHSSPEEFWYDQVENEWVAVLSGQARLQFEDCVVELSPGDFIDIPARCKHRVAWTGDREPTVWLAIFYQ